MKIFTFEIESAMKIRIMLDNKDENDEITTSSVSFSPKTYVKSQKVLIDVISDE